MSSFCVQPSFSRQSKPSQMLPSTSSARDLEVQDQVDLGLASARREQDLAHLERLQLQTQVLLDAGEARGVVVLRHGDAVSLQVLEQHARTSHVVIATHVARL